MAGYCICSSLACRNLLGIWSGRGPLLGRYDGAAIYETDISRNDAEEADKRDSSNENSAQTDAKLTSRSEVGANIALEYIARHQPLSYGAIDRKLDLTRSQFRPPLSWANAMRTNGLSLWSLRYVIAGNLRSQAWIENKIAAALTPSDQECTAYYDSHRNAFVAPPRLRARHVFFAAPPGSPPDLVERKRGLAQGILDRLAHGETLEKLAAESEDESNKKTGGDLNFFAESRVPADFWAAVRNQHPGDAAGLIRTRLGFHVLQVTDARPAQEMPTDEARKSVLLALQNEKRRASVAALRRDLLAEVQWIPKQPSTR